MAESTEKWESDIDLRNLRKELIDPTPGLKIDVEEVVLQAEVEKDEAFASKFSYLLLLIGSAVGFGNIWRFPYLMQQNGGVVFLIPYALLLAVLGIPIVFLELAIGQRLRKGCLKAWVEVSVYVGGLGAASGFACLLLGFYYNTLIAWCWFYFFSVFHDELGWSDCNTTDGHCLTNFSSSACEDCERSGPSSYYFYHNVLQISSGIDDPKQFSWKIFGCLVLSWVSTWAILIKGIKVTARIAYVTALLPYSVLIIFFVHGLTLDGMELGFQLIFLPNWSKLLEVEVWFTAGTQIFFSLGLGFGILVSFSSLISPNNNCYKDAIFVSLVNSLTSVFAATVVFPTLGYKGKLAFDNCKEHALSGEMGTFQNVTSPNDTHVTGFSNSTGLVVLCDLIKFVTESASGPGLIFIAFTEAIKSLPFPQGWAFLFFLMLLTLGIDSEFAAVESAIYCLYDWNMFGLTLKKWVVTTGVCFFLMCISLGIFCWGWGEYVLAFLDEFSTNWTTLIIALGECIAIGWIYGLRKFSYDIHLMTGRKPNLYIMFCWKFISPALLCALLIGLIIQYCISTTAQKYEVWKPELSKTVLEPWPTHIIFMGLGIVLVVTGPIPVFAVLARFKIFPVKPEPSCEFPEEELRSLRGITVADDDKPDTRLEKLLFWGTSKPHKVTEPAESASMPAAAAVAASQKVNDESEADNGNSAGATTSKLAES